MGKPGRPALYHSDEERKAAQARANLKWRQKHKGQWRLIQRNAYRRRRGLLGDKLPPLEREVVPSPKKEVVMLSYGLIEGVDTGYGAPPVQAPVKSPVTFDWDSRGEPDQETPEHARVKAELLRFSAKRASREGRVVVEGFE